MVNPRPFLRLLFCIFAFSIIGISQCPNNSDALYDREKLLAKLEGILKTSIPIYERASNPGFFIYDLTDPSNNYISSKSNTAENCINFVDGHIYHFSAVEFEESLSHIAVLESGSLKIFKSINCVNGENTLSDAIEYIRKKAAGIKNKSEALIRLNNYRRYGHYRTTDGYRVSCNWDNENPENLDKLYDRNEVLGQFSDVLRNSVSEKVREQLSWRFFVEESRANGFFIYDLTEPTNKQTSLLERVEFKNNHVYHFAFIDWPFSFSNIAVLQDGQLKIFKTINCEGKGDSFQDLIGYLNKKLKTDKDKNETINRVKNYRKYGLYASFKGLTTPQCKEAVSAEK